MKTNHTFVCFGLFIAFSLFAGNKSFGQLKADFSSNVQSGCAPLVVAFEDETTGNASFWKWTLGNGTVATIQDPVTTYFDAGTYTVKLTVKNASGEDSVTKTSYITVYANPQVDFKASETEGCFPLNVNFANNGKAGSGTISEYLWDFGDGNILNTAAPSHTYTTTGVFDVTLKVTNSFGCYNAVTKSDLIQIDNGVNANFKLTSFNVCSSPAAAVFKNTSNGTGSLSYQWNFGDGSTSTEASPTHSYNGSDEYNVVLTVQSSSGCSDTATMDLVANLPSSTFNLDDATCLNHDIQFTNTSVPKPVSCRWYFGDGTTSKAFDPVKAYDKTGSYTVKLVNEFASGCSDSTIRTINIATGPTAFFSADDTTKCSAPLTVNFTNKTTGEASAYIWDFGDGTTSTETNPSHTYLKQGSFTVQLTAINSNGCQSVFEKPKYISVQPIKITGLENLPDSGCVPLAVKPSVLLNNDYSIKNYLWDFGDGITSSDKFPTHNYTKEGAFNVKVSIETTDGCKATYVLPNAVLAGHKPIANFTVDKDSACANSAREFTNTSTNGPITFLRWDYGDIVEADLAQHFSKDPIDTGYKRVTLVAYNYGCADTLQKKSAIYIIPPLAGINFKKHCDNRLMVDFTDVSLGSDTYTWNFGDGQTSAAKNPSHAYASPGNYSVILNVTNKTCHDSASANISVINEMGSIVIANAAYCRKDTIAAEVAGINIENIKNIKWDFGDGTIITVNGDAKVSHAYLASGKYEIKARMVDKNNCLYFYEAKDSIDIYGPKAVFSSEIPAVCFGSSVSFKDKSSADGVHNIVKWTWDYGDSTIQEYNSATTFSHNYTDVGRYSVRLKVTDSYGCTDSAKKNNYISISRPFAAYIPTDSIICPGKKVVFSDSSTGDNLSYLWDFGDGTQSTEQSPAYNYKKGGIYYPALFVTDENGCRDSVQLNPLRVSVPAAKFLMSDSLSTCPPLQVDFTNQSTDFSSVTWDFGDGSPSVITSPSHVYTYPGIYPVKLKVKGYGNCADSASKIITIKGPTGKVTYKASPLCYPDTTKFLATTVNVVKYTWDFSDGNTVSTIKNNIAHSYAPGLYVPKIILEDSTGCKVSIKGEDTIRVYDVTANATVSGSPACDSTPVLFKDLSESKDNIIHHYWFFGDGSSVDKQNIAHSYNLTGAYNAYVIAETKTGCRDTFYIPDSVLVLPVPEISITADSVVCSMAFANFKGNAVVKDDSMNWNWNFGNGETFSGENASIAYKRSGEYNVTLIASGANGCADTASKKIIVHGLPKVKAGKDTTICKNSNYQLTASGAANYVWSGAALSCTNCASPEANPNTSSTYIVTGKDDIGCAASDTVNISVIQPARITVSEGDTLCIGESKQFHVSGAQTYQWYPPVYLNDDKSDQPVFTAAKDTSITYEVIGHTAKNCFADTGYISVKAYPIPKLDIEHSEIYLNVGSSVQLNAASSPDITEWHWQPSKGLSDATIANPIASPTETTTYSCVASNGGSCVSRDEITIRIICGDKNVFIPNTFSPNGDGMNDYFYVRGNGLFKIKSFRVFNRWGQPVFERFNASPNNADEGWNGMFNGKSLASDVYVYIIEVLCDNNAVIPFKGNITLLK